MGVLTFVGWGMLAWGWGSQNPTLIILGMAAAPAFSTMWFLKKLWEWSKENATRGLK